MRLAICEKYAEAVGLNFIAGFVPRYEPTDKVRCHVLTIKKHMDDLAL